MVRYMNLVDVAKVSIPLNEFVPPEAIGTSPSRPGPAEGPVGPPLAYAVAVADLVRVPFDGRVAARCATLLDLTPTQTRLPYTS